MSDNWGTHYGDKQELVFWVGISETRYSERTLSKLTGKSTDIMSLGITTKILTDNGIAEKLTDALITERFERTNEAVRGETWLQSHRTAIRNKQRKLKIPNGADVILKPQRTAYGKYSSGTASQTEQK